MNGLFATLVHYGALSFMMEVLEISTAGGANLIAASFGISASFLGNRYFVFRKRDEPFFLQLSSFGLLYFSIALLHGAVLAFWADVLKLDYRVGFLMATLMQFLLSFVGNKLIVFKT